MRDVREEILPNGDIRKLSTLSGAARVYSLIGRAVAVRTASSVPLELNELFRNKNNPWEE